MGQETRLLQCLLSSKVGSKYVAYIAGGLVSSAVSRGRHHPPHGEPCIGGQRPDLHTHAHTGCLCSKFTQLHTSLDGHGVFAGIIGDCLVHLVLQDAHRDDILAAAAGLGGVSGH